MKELITALKNYGFNTQPRGGGCKKALVVRAVVDSFNTQPRGGGCLPTAHPSGCHYGVSTHSRAEAAASIGYHFVIDTDGFNTQPRGGGCC